MTMGPDHQEKVFYNGVCITTMTISLFMIGGPGSNLAHSQSIGLLLLISPSKP